MKLNEKHEKLIGHVRKKRDFEFAHTLKEPLKTGNDILYYYFSLFRF